MLGFLNPYIKSQADCLAVCAIEWFFFALNDISLADDSYKSQKLRKSFAQQNLARCYAQTGESDAYE